MNLRNEKIALIASVALFAYLAWPQVFGSRGYVYEDEELLPQSGPTQEWEEAKKPLRFRDPFARLDLPDAYTLRAMQFNRNRRARQATPSTGNRESLLLNGTVVSGEIRCATINSSVYFEGDTFLHPPEGGATYRVSRIAPGRVTLESDSGPIVLAVPDGMKRKHEARG